MKPPRLLIIGNGGAALSAVQAARAAGHSGPIHLISKTPGPAFNPMLSPYYLAGEIQFEQCFPFGREFYGKYAVEQHFGSSAKALDPLNKKVYLRGGESLSYDRCMIATGASPAIPEVPGLKGSPHVFTLRTAEETRRLHKSLSEAKNAVILGASLVGVKLAEILVQRGIRVSLMDIEDQILPRLAHSECASLLADNMVRNDVALHLGLTLEGAEDDKKGIHLHFQGNRLLTTDLCLVCTGIKPNMDLLDNSHVEIDQGILIDDRMRTSADDLYAAGDVSQGMNRLSGKKEVVGLWANACYQGRTAGFNMAGWDVSYPGTIPQYVNTFFGLTFVHLGDINRQGKDVMILSNHDLSEGFYRLLVFDRGVLVGVNLINGIQSAGKMKTVIIRKLDWDKDLERFINDPTDREIDQILNREPCLMGNIGVRPPKCYSDNALYKIPA